MKKVIAMKKFLAAVIFMLSLVNICAASNDLKFDSSGGIEKSLTYNGREIKFIAYENIPYVTEPASEIQKLSVYVPAEYLRGGKINGYTAKTAPIFLPNGVGGYMPGKILEPVENDKMSGGANASLVALSRGLVVISPAIRGRTTTMNGVYVGKAPAFIVDYKAAVRWIRFNRATLPAGDVEKIISNGTSAGGALSALLGATGNAPEYKTYLDELGSADERDDIFASSDYCPITNLENADSAYEWIFCGENKYFPAMWQLQDLEARGKRTPQKVAEKSLDSDAANNPVAVKNSIDMTADEISASKILRDAFPTYLNSLNLRDEYGNLLTLDKNGNGSFKNFIKSKYIESAQSALDNGVDLSSVDWVKIKNNRVVDVDLKKYPAAVTRMKAAPAFDKLDLSSAENDEFGTSKNEPRHFSSVNKIYQTGEFANDGLISLMNPLNFIGRQDVTTAKFFRIRHGAADRDTSLAVPAILALKLQNNGVNVNFFSPWARGHGGDYDLDELFDWIDSICK
ncbi:MAG: alpha/beta hydrolase [Selenomonadaceae bacterium]|nr:alpha/beta hydrolase [Selenomonadaceae bacterium]